MDTGQTKIVAQSILIFIFNGQMTVLKYYWQLFNIDFSCNSITMKQSILKVVDKWTQDKHKL